MTLLSIGMLVYILIIKPFKSSLNSYELVSYELCVIAVNICVMMLAKMDSDNNNDIEKRDQIAKIIITVNIIFYACGMIFLVT